MAAATAACPPPAKATSNGAFQGDNPLDFALPLLILQMCLVFVVTRGLAVLLRPLRQPRVIAEIIGGILLGPSALGRNTTYLHKVFPPRSLTVLDTVANLGLLFFLFLVGLELNMKAVTRTGKRALGIALAGISLPFALGIGTSFVLRATISKGVSGPAFLVFMGVALSITAFPVLARILAELKLLTTDVGRLAMSAAAVNDVVAWILLALAIALSGTGRSPLVTLWVLLSGLLFVVCAVFVFRPIFAWMARRTPEGGQVDEIYVCATLTAVLAAGFVTDVIGIHALFGAFVLGILVPKEGPFAGALVEKVEDIVSGLFLPLYFVSSGLKTNVTTIRGAQSWGVLVLVISTACLGKILGTFTVSIGCGVSCRESLTLGILMNTKGLVELIVLNIGKDRKVLNDQTFAIMVLMALFTTFVTTPLVTYIYRPARRGNALYKHRTIERKDASSQLRMLACFHSTRSIPTLINLVECSRGSARREKLCFYALHLTELSERSSAILMVQRARKNGRPFWNKTLPSDSGQQHVVAFEAFQRLSGVSVRPMTAISALSDIHEDICGSAERKAAALVVLPFHKHQRLDGALETTRPELRGVNQRVLEHAPCSVGILVDRGLGGATHVSASNVSLSVTCVFLGGPDDREALSYGMRMAEHPGVRLTVLRLVGSEALEAAEITAESADGDASQLKSGEDGDILGELRALRNQDGRAVQYVEKVVAGAGEAAEAIKSFSRCDLVLAGRKPGGGGAVSPVLSEWDEFPELGPVGSLLTSQGFPARASVLVLQQYSRTTVAVAPGAIADDHHRVQIPEAGDSSS